MSAVSSPAPFSMRIRANSRCPLATARARGVDPSISHNSMAVTPKYISLNILDTISISVFLFYCIFLLKNFLYSHVVLSYLFANRFKSNTVSEFVQLHSPLSLVIHLKYIFYPYNKDTVTHSVSLLLTVLEPRHQSFRIFITM